MSHHLRTIAVAAATVLMAGSVAASSVLRPDEAASKDTFVYAFAIPGTLGIPGAPNMLNFDTVNIPDSAAVPFGSTLGAAETTPFVNPEDPDFPTTIREHTTRSLLAFDVASLGIAADRVESATFQITGIGNLFPFDPPSLEFPIQVDLKPVLEVWDEQTVTWDTRPAVGAVTASYTMTDGFETLNFDVTDLVRSWLATPSDNFGFELSQAGIVPTPPGMPGGRERFAVGLFASSATADPMMRPSLTVSEIPVPAALPLLAGGVALLAGVARRRRNG